MANKGDIHVLPHPDIWAAKREGVQRAGSVHGTQRNALEGGSDDTPTGRHDQRQRQRRQRPGASAGQEILVSSSDGQPARLDDDAKKAVGSANAVSRRRYCGC